VRVPGSNTVPTMARETRKHGSLGKGSAFARSPPGPRRKSSAAFYQVRDKREGQPECVMDWNRIEGNWKQFKGRAKEKWGRLTDDDLDVINGRQEQLEGKIQERYGLAKDQAKKDVEDWFNSLP
jgi:uncharacterized protein YjbJ (UPF0337 family)